MVWFVGCLYFISDLDACLLENCRHFISLHLSWNELILYWCVMCVLNRERCILHLFWCLASAPHVHSDPRIHPRALHSNPCIHPPCMQTFVPNPFRTVSRFTFIRKYYVYTSYILRSIYVRVTYSQFVCNRFCSENIVISVSHCCLVTEFCTTSRNEIISRMKSQDRHSMNWVLAVLDVDG